MTNGKKRETSRGAGRFEPGGDLGPIEDRNEREHRTASLPADERLLAEECARFADLCQYFSQQHMDLPGDVVAEFGGISSLPVQTRIKVMKRLNQSLMEHLNGAGQDSRIRQ